MTNAERILTVLDSHLDHTVELTLFGRAALALGYSNPPNVVERSLDVDAIIPVSQLRHLESDIQFWEALERANAELEGDGLYLTHLFQEDQIALTPDWLSHRVRISLISVDRLHLFRPSTIDLILTKMMRGADEEDLVDIRFLLSLGEIAKEELECALNRVVLPEVDEIRAFFDEARTRVIREMEKL